MHTQSRLLLPLNAKRETFAFCMLAALHGKVSAKQSLHWQPHRSHGSMTILDVFPLLQLQRHGHARLVLVFVVEMLSLP